MKKTAKGSISIYLGISLTIILALISTVVESAREIALTARLQEVTYMAEDAVFSEYIASMFEDYGLMFLYESEEEIENKIQDYADFNLSASLPFQKNYNLLKAKAEKVELSGPVRAADNGGKAFIEEVEEYMKYALPKDILNEISGRYSGASLQKTEITDLVSASDNGENPEDNEGYKEAVGIVDNIKEAIATGVLALVTDVEGLSSNRVDCSNLPSKTSYRWSERYNATLAQNTLMTQYAVTEFKNFTNKGNGPLQYEVEQIIGQKGSDRENLANVVEKIIGIREAANFAYLLTDEVKMGEAMTMAIALAGISCNPAIVKAVQMALLGGWALAESIADVKTLLAGNRVSLVKTASEWQTSLAGIKNIAETVGPTGGISSKDGLDYEQYLYMLLAAENTSKVAFGAMDVIQLNISQKENADFDMAESICAITAEVSYKSNQVFTSFGFVKKLIGRSRGFEKNINQYYSY